MSPNSETSSPPSSPLFQDGRSRSTTAISESPASSVSGELPHTPRDRLFESELRPLEQLVNDGGVQNKTPSPPQPPTQRASPRADPTQLPDYTEHYSTVAVDMCIKQVLFDGRDRIFEVARDKGVDPYHPKRGQRYVQPTHKPLPCGWKPHDTEWRSIVYGDFASARQENKSLFYAPPKPSGNTRGYISMPSSSTPSAVSPPSEYPGTSPQDVQALHEYWYSLFPRRRSPHQRPDPSASSSLTSMMIGGGRSTPDSGLHGPSKERFHSPFDSISSEDKRAHQSDSEDEDEEFGRPNTPSSVPTHTRTGSTSSSPPPRYASLQQQPPRRPHHRSMSPPSSSPFATRLSPPSSQYRYGTTPPSDSYTNEFADYFKFKQEALDREARAANAKSFVGAIVSSSPSSPPLGSSTMRNAADTGSGRPRGRRSYSDSSSSRPSAEVDAERLRQLIDSFGPFKGRRVAREEGILPPLDAGSTTVDSEQHPQRHRRHSSSHPTRPSDTRSSTVEKRSTARLQRQSVTEDWKPVMPVGRLMASPPNVPHAPSPLRSCTTLPIEGSPKQTSAPIVSQSRGGRSRSRFDLVHPMYRASSRGGIPREVIQEEDDATIA